VPFTIIDTDVLLDAARNDTTGYDATVKASQTKEVEK